MRQKSPTSNRQVLLRFSAAGGIAIWASALANSEETNSLKLLPPYGELPSTFWQQQGATLIFVAFLAISVVAVFAWLLHRPRAATVPPPQVQARSALERLVNCAEDGDIVSKTSQILRRYVVAAFALSPGEATTGEFCRMISSHEGMGAELSNAVGEFLRHCDEQKFSPQPPAEPLGAARRALELVSLAEARREQLRQPQPNERKS